MLDALSNFSINTSYMPSIGWRDFLDIIIVAFLIYKIIFWVRETRAWSLFKGIAIILIFTAFAVSLQLNTIIWILSNAVSVGIIALIVVFQPELRRALEQLGSTGLLSNLINFDMIRGSETTERVTKKTIDELVKAVDKMSQAKTGALILIERSVPLGDHERTGIPIDSIVTSQLLINIFEHNTPLHDGAVIIKNNRVAAATCFLPLTERKDVSMELGTRHRAAIGASEVSDADVLVVSEETGGISLARSGILYRNLSPETLSNMLLGKQSKGRKKRAFWKGKQSNE